MTLPAHTTRQTVNTPTSRKRNQAETPPLQTAGSVRRMPLGQLEGFTVAVTADRRWEQQAELLTRRGARVIHAPTIHTDYLTSDATLEEATRQLLARPPDVLVATTGIGVRAWFEAAQAWGLAEQLHSALKDARLVARGPKAGAALEANGLPGATRVASESMEEVVAVVVDGCRPGTVVAIQEYGQHAAPEVTGALRSAGACVVSVPVYRWRLPSDPSPALRLVDALAARDVDAVTFTSAPAVHNLFELAGSVGRADETRRAFNEGRVVAACVGPVCADNARAVGIEAPVAPAVGRLGLLVRALGETLAERRTVLASPGAPVTIQGGVVERAGRTALVPGKERELLERLAAADGAPVGKTVLARAVWGAPAGGDTHVVEVTAARLRRRLAPLGVSVVAQARRGYRLQW